MARQLLTRTLAVAAAFLLVTPFIPFYDNTEGSFLEETGVMELTEQDLESTVANVMTEDGFLLKPSITTTKGDRSGFSDIFAYTIQPGDTLSSISKQFDLKKETIQAANGLWNADRLKVGSTLKILPVDGVAHLVKKGDSLDKVAKKYKVDKELIAKQNQLENGAELEVDSYVIVPGAKIEAPTYVAGTSYSAPSAIPASFAGGASGRLLWPTGPGYQLTQGFHRGHYALDIANRNKGPIYAAASGKVVKASYGWNGGYGNVIIIDHGNGMQTLYGHNEKLYVEVGQYVEQGQTISWMGRSGQVRGVTGIHVHFEVRINGVKYNPMNFF